MAREPREEREDPSGVVPTAVSDVDGATSWLDARTVLGAPSFAVLAAERAAMERASEVVRRSAEGPSSDAPVDTSPPILVDPTLVARSSVERSGVERSGVERSSVERSSVELGSSVQNVDEPSVPVMAPLDAFDAFDAAFDDSVRTEAEAPSFSSLEIPIDVDEPEPLALDVSIAPQSESAIWEGLEGELGVFLATYDELPLGTDVTLTVHLTGERPFVSRARVVWLRSAPGLWPGLGLRLLENRPDVWFRLQRFARRWRAPMFHCE